MRRYAITNRTLFPQESSLPHPPQSYRERWDPQQSTQLSALLRQTALWATESIDYIQLREKDLPAAALASLTRSILEILHNTPTRLLINSRLDVAIASAAHGVHLTAAPGQLTPAQVRKLYADATLPPPIISISCHTLAEVAAARNNADLILFSPIFHKSVAGELINPGQGLEALRAACFAAAPTPIYALGGVTLENAPACLEAGAAGVAGIHLFHTP
ncbi:thiamine phosphate synthase [Edaphobacter sp. DSM 109919]|uniref:Thiamine phosphate synthase n=1 Tax=Edaphobacter paludis TaxID=3035702 RepID=A0AAU7CXS8_9BACT